MYSFSDNEIEAQVLEAMSKAGCSPVGSSSLILDSKIHRYKVADDRGSEKSGSYCIHTDGWPAGWFEDWHSGEAVTWRFDGEGKFTPNFFESEEYKEMCRLSNEHQKKLKAEREATQKEAILKAREEWNMATEIEGIPTFPYLLQKHVNAYGIRLRLNLNSLMYGHGDKNGLLVIPLRNINGEIQTLQYIDEQGGKRFFTDAPVKGAFFSIALDERFLNEHPAMPILLCEGYATAVTVYQGIYNPVVAAMTAGNLLPVAEALKGKYPGHPIIIMADNDRHADGRNTGLEKAREAVRKLGLQGIIYPEFSPEEEGSDWNDYAALHGVVETVHLLRELIALELQPADIKAMRTSGRLEAINAQTLRTKTLSPIKWAVEGFLPSGLTILGGGPKTGKSIMALHLAIGVAIGGCVLGKIDVLQGDVLYLALEDNERRLQERLNSSNILPEDCNVSRLDLVTRLPRQHEGGLNFISWWLEHHHNARLVIIDTLQMFRKQLSGKGGVYGEDYDAVAEIKKVADKYDVAFLVLHHLKKVSAKEEMLGDWINQFSGSAGLSGSADTLFILRRARTDKYGTLYRTGRDVEEKNFRMRLDGFGWVLEGEAEDFTLPAWKKQILDFLKEHETVTPMELSDAYSLNIKTAQGNLTRLLKEGIIKKDGHGTYKLA